MKKILKIFGVFAFGYLLGWIGYAIADPRAPSPEVESCLVEIASYHNYYFNVEAMLDSLGIYYNHPILNTSVGQKYLYSKDRLDSVRRINYYGCPPLICPGTFRDYNDAETKP